MNIIDKIKEMTDGVFNPQPVNDYIGTTGQSPANGSRVQGSLGSYAQPRNQFQGGGLPLYSNNISVRQPNFGQIRNPSTVFNPMDIFNEGLEINPYGRTPAYPSDQYKEKEYLSYR